MEAGECGVGQPSTSTQPQVPINSLYETQQDSDSELNPTCPAELDSTQHDSNISLRLTKGNENLLKFRSYLQQFKYEKTLSPGKKGEGVKSAYKYEYDKKNTNIENIGLLSPSKQLLSSRYNDKISRQKARNENGNFSYFSTLSPGKKGEGGDFT